MRENERFRILTPEGLVTFDTFALANRQPRTIKPGCVLLVHEADGRPLTVHRTRLVATEGPGILDLDHQGKSVCLKCGRVEGVVEDDVACPQNDHTGCGLIEAKQ